jgi:hypothetical protein
MKNGDRARVASGKVIPITMYTRESAHTKVQTAAERKRILRELLNMTADFKFMGRRVYVRVARRNKTTGKTVTSTNTGYVRLLHEPRSPLLFDGVIQSLVYSLTDGSKL